MKQNSTQWNYFSITPPLMYSELGPLSLKFNLRKLKKSDSEKKKKKVLKEIRLYFKFNLLISNSFLTVHLWVLAWACDVCINRHDLPLNEWNSLKFTVLDEGVSWLPLLRDCFELSLSLLLFTHQKTVQHWLFWFCTSLPHETPSSGETYQNWCKDLGQDWFLPHANEEHMSLKLSCC